LLGRDINKTIIVDNIRDNFERQPNNGIEILTWLHDATDRELYKLSIFLKNIVANDISNVRDQIMTYTNETWKTQSPSKRSYINQKQGAIIIDNTDSLSPIRSNKKGERYSGTPHHQKISPTKMKVVPMQGAGVHQTKPKLHVQITPKKELSSRPKTASTGTGGCMSA